MKPDGTMGREEPPLRSFQLPAGGPDWRTAVVGFVLRAEAAGETREELLDGCDRRLQRAGLALSTRRSEAGLEAHLRDLDARGEGALATLPRRPRFAWDFPPPLDARLARELEARALEPLGEHVVRRRPWSVLDGSEKRVAWLEEEEHRLGDDEPRARRLLLRAVRGYPREFERLAAALVAAGFVADARVELDPRQWLPAAPPEPARVTPAPGEPAFLALGRIVAAQLAVLNGCEDGLRRALDDEYLHDYRVALRRLRALIGQLDGLLVAEEHARIVHELRTLARATGPARDLDVLLFDLRLAAPDLRPALAPAVAALEVERRRLQPELLSGLDQAAQLGTLSRLAAAFAPHRPAQELGPRAGKPFARVLARRLARRLEQARKRTHALDRTRPPAALHELRITFKKLRYLLECARGLVPRAELDTAFATLKGLQSVLGTLQDAAVQAELVTRLATGPAAGAGVGAHLALGRYLGEVEQRARAAREHFDEQARGFLAPAGHGALERLFAELEAGEGAP